MRVLMLGWEFPPYIAGGLGTACAGLTKSLARVGQDVAFVLPKPVDPGAPSHVRLLSPASLREPEADLGGAVERAIAAVADPHGAEPIIDRGADLGEAPIDAAMDTAMDTASGADPNAPIPGFNLTGGGPEMSGAYPAFLPTSQQQSRLLARLEAALQSAAGEGADTAQLRILKALASSGVRAEDLAADYSVDMLTQASKYAALALAIAARERFDLIHAHDWMTYPAAMTLKRVTGKPLVCHIHSTEFDRSGEGVNQPLYDIERAGMHAADRVIAVSMLTKSLVVARYGVPAEKIDVVYNGVEQESAQPNSALDRIEAGDKIVLFLGRITMQKGPEYFIGAAKRVLEKQPNTKFIVAGSGDMALRMIDLAAEMGVGHKVFFTGFLRGADVERVFRMADCYVMPSVSEPFGIAALEALHNQVPVIISKTSGVSEVLTHALKVDFWDTDEMANKIVAVLRHPPLRQTLREHAPFELRRLTWDGAAERCVQVYADVLS
ncbi:MAG: glycosyltransferase family 4 protein [Planctomycetota bacterium]